LNAQCAEESYQLKRENCTLRKQLENRNHSNIDQAVQQNNTQNSSDVVLVSNDKELEILRDTVERLTGVGVFMFSLPIHSRISYRKIVVYNAVHRMKLPVYKKN
jgi:chlorite dismutase